jgi:hypothetical protein
MARPRDGSSRGRFVLGTYLDFCNFYRLIFIPKSLCNLQ